MGPCLPEQGRNTASRHLLGGASGDRSSMSTGPSSFLSAFTPRAHQRLASTSVLGPGPAEGRSKNRTRTSCPSRHGPGRHPRTFGPRRRRGKGKGTRAPIRGTKHGNEALVTALLHTHPDTGSPRPSVRDRAVARRLRLPVYTISLWAIYRAEPDGTVSTIASPCWTPTVDWELADRLLASSLGNPLVAEGSSGGTLPGVEPAVR